MPRITFPNQRMVNIHRERVTTDFLGIKNENWMAAARDLRPHALLLYLYFASNADNYTLALSPSALRQEIGMARSTYNDQFQILVDKGYLVNSHGNTFEFYEKPMTDTKTQKMSAAPEQEEMACSSDGQQKPQVDQVRPSENREINNSNFQNKTLINNREDRGTIIKSPAEFIF